MVSSISGSSGGFDISSLQELMKSKATEMFSNLSKEAGGDGTSISKDQLQSLIDKNKKEGKDTKPLEDIVSNFDKISTSKDSNGNSIIKADDMDNAMKNGTLKPPSEPPAKKSAQADGTAKSSSSSSSTSTSSTSSQKLTKDQLQSYYNQLLKQGDGDSSIAEELKSAISNYGKSGSSSLTESGIQQAIQALAAEKTAEAAKSKTSKNEIQDPSTITADQLEHPIDLRV